MELKQHCGTQARRQKVSATNKLVGGLKINGIDYLEVLDEDAPSTPMRQRYIDVTFLKKDGVLDNANALVLKADNFSITGGVRITGISITAIAKGPNDLTVRLTLDRYGDFSRYKLMLTDGISDEPPSNFDPVLSQLDFSFKADCPTDFDCLPLSAEPKDAGDSPSIDYLAKDYESFRRLMLDRMAVTIPAWTERSPADLGVALVEALAYGADMASYYQDAVATEAYLARARLRASARRHARLVGYAIGEGCNARAFVAIQATQDVESAAPPVLAKGTMLLTRPATDKGFGLLDTGLKPDPVLINALIRAGVRTFETMEDVSRLLTSRNELKFHTWSGTNCCLPAGTQVAHLVGTLAETKLQAGDVLIFEERVPLGGTSDDPPDPARRQAVRLTQTPREYTDLLDDTPVMEVRWGLADALTFALNLQGSGSEPGAVAYGNVVLADDGRTLDYATVNAAGTDPLVAAASIHADLYKRSALYPSEAADGAPYRPVLSDAPITRGVPYDPLKARLEAAATALLQSAGMAQPIITLTGAGETWVARSDLLLSDRFAAEFVVETTNSGGASLRFGDGRFGKSPASGTGFLAKLRVGNGPSGRIGSGAIGHIVTDNPTLIASLTNPLPAVGGDSAETMTAIKLAAPRAFKIQKRAVTAQDYADVANKHPDVQRAVAERRWTGSWHTIFIAVDRKGGRDTDAAFEAELRAFIEPYRLAGHDLEIEPPTYVPLDVALVVCVAPGHYAEHVETALLDQFSARISAIGTRGFYHADNFTFGQSALLSPVIATAMAIPGVRWVGMQIDGFAQTGRFRRLDDQSVDYADTGVLKIGRREVARLDNDPNAPERGRLRFYMEGGR
jgi:hypothetical protein